MPSQDILSRMSLQLFYRGCLSSHSDSFYSETVLLNLFSWLLPAFLGIFPPITPHQEVLIVKIAVYLFMDFMNIYALYVNKDFDFCSPRTSFHQLRGHGACLRILVLKQEWWGSFGLFLLWLPGSSKPNLAHTVSETWFYSSAFQSISRSLTNPSWLYLFIYLFSLFRATPAAYGSSQARSRIGAAATSLHQSHSNTRSRPRLQSIPADVDCNLHSNARSFNLLTEARDRTCILTDTSQVLNLLSHNRNSPRSLLKRKGFWTCFSKSLM